MREETEKERRAREEAELRAYNERLGPGVKFGEGVDIRDNRHFGRGWTEEDKKKIREAQAKARAKK